MDRILTALTSASAARVYMLVLGAGCFIASVKVDQLDAQQALSYAGVLLVGWAGFSKPGDK